MTPIETVGPFKVDSGPTLVAVRDGVKFSRRLWVDGHDAPTNRPPEPGELVRYLFTTDRDERPSGEGILVSVTYDDGLPVCVVLWSEVPVFSVWDPQF